MKNKQKGFIVSLLIIIVMLGVIWVGIYEYQKNRQSIQTERITQNSEATSTVIVASISATSPEVNNSNIDIHADWKTYSDQKYGISFKYPKEWGDVLAHDEGGTIYENENNRHVIRIATDNNKATDCIPFHGPQCKMNPDVQIFIQQGENLMSHFIDVVNYNPEDIPRTKISTNVDGYKALMYSYNTPINSVNGPAADPDGYEKYVLLGIEKTSKVFVEIAFASPTFSTIKEAQVYNTDDFKNFLSTIKFTSI